MVHISALIPVAMLAYYVARTLQSVDAIINNHRKGKSARGRGRSQ